MTIVSRAGKLILAALACDGVTEAALWGKLRRRSTIHRLNTTTTQISQTRYLIVFPTWLDSQATWFAGLGLGQTCRP